MIIEIGTTMAGQSTELLTKLRVAHSSESVADFCAAMQYLVDVLRGSRGMDVIINDVTGNCDKLERTLGNQFNTMKLSQCCAVHEGGDVSLEEQPRTWVVWLSRTLNFVQEALALSGERHDDTATEIFREAYSRTLSRHHGIATKAIAWAAMACCPSRAEMDQKLGGEDGRRRTAQASKRLLGDCKDALVNAGTIQGMITSVHELV